MSLSRYRGQIILMVDVCLIFVCNFLLFLPNLMNKDIQLKNLVAHIGLLTLCVLVFQLAFKTYKAKLGIWAARLYFTTENAREVDRILADYLNPEPFDPGACTRGLYLRGVE